jgi:hypothetical protein
MAVLEAAANEKCRCRPHHSARDQHSGEVKQSQFRLYSMQNISMTGKLLATGHLLARGIGDAKTGFTACFPHQTNISAIIIPHYRSFDAVDLAVARICCLKGIYCYNL